MSAFARLRGAENDDKEKVSVEVTEEVKIKSGIAPNWSETSGSLNKQGSQDRTNVKRRKVSTPKNANDNEIMQIDEEEEDGIKSAIELGLINGTNRKSSDSNDSENSDTNDSTDSSSDDNDDNDDNDNDENTKQKANAKPIQIDFGMGMKTVVTSSNRHCIDAEVTTGSTIDPESINYYEDNVIIGLRAGDTLILKGKYKITVQKGAITINTVVFHASERHTIDIEASSLASLPVIRPTSVRNKQLVHNVENKWNANLFIPAYMSVVKIENWIDGSDKIGLLYPQLKNIYCSNEDMRANKDLPFSGYSFRPVVLSSEGEIGTTELEDWKYHRNALTSEIQEDQRSNKGRSSTLLMIGGKNSGKSTFLRLLLNHLVCRTDSRAALQVAVLDIDPGQTEFSDPGCISISMHKKPIFGSINPLYQRSERGASSVPGWQEFIGFTSPQTQPQSFFRKLRKLIDNLPVDCPVLVNTPGWIKGFGVQIFQELTRMMQITHLLLFTNSERPENDRHLLEGLQFDSLTRLTGFHLPSEVHITKYSSAHIRNFKLLSYFHFDLKSRSYDFTPLLARSPYQIPYSSCGKGYEDNLQRKSLAFISLLDANSNINAEDVDDFLVFQVVGVFTVGHTDAIGLFDSLTDSARQNGRLVQKAGLPNIAVECSQLLEEADMEYHGLALIHSIDHRRECVNLYTPIDVSGISKLMTEQNRTLVFVKGGLKYPVQEMYPESMYQAGEIDCSEIESGWIPYLSFNRDVGKGGKAVNTRHNIQRRNLKG